MIQTRLWRLFAVGLLLMSALGSACTSLPRRPPAKAVSGGKYGPSALPLSELHDFFSRAPAPDFWALIPFLRQQSSGKSCSATSVTMLLNGLRGSSGLGAEDRLLSESDVLHSTADPHWEADLGAEGHGVTLAELRVYLEEALRAFGYPLAQVISRSVPDSAPTSLVALREALRENERTADDFIVANFDQGILTGDKPAGHIALIGAYDEQTKMVLVLDPDREWYEPYWVPDTLLLSAMAAPDSISGTRRGFLWITVRTRPKAAVPGHR